MSVLAGKTADKGWRSVILEMVTGLRAAVLRFPVPTLFVAAATIQANLVILGIGLLTGDRQPGASDEILAFSFQCGALAALAAALFGEARGLAPALRSAMALAAGITATAALAFPRTFLATEWTLLPALAGLVLVAPFILRGSSGSFWMFSARVAFAAILGILALLLFAGGISAILASLTVLFGLTVPEELYQHVWASTGLFAAPLFALGQFPREFDEQPSHAMAGFMDRGMRALGDFVAAPLLIVYAVILHLYALKIVFTGEVPEGQIGWLVLVYGLCIFGALLVINPFFDHARAPTRLFLRLWPFFLPIPLVLLFYALAVRVSAYGITPERYLLGLFGLVIAAILLVQLWPRLRGDIRVIAAVPAAALLFASFGPQGALGVSLASQTGRFLAIVQNPPVEGKRHDEALSALQFLESQQALARVAPAGADASDQTYEAIARAWGLDPHKAIGGPSGFALSEGSTPSAIAVTGFDTVVQNVQLGVSADRPVSVRLPSGPQLLFTLEPDAIVVAIGEERTRFPLAAGDIEQMTRIGSAGAPVEIPLESGGRRIMVLPSYLYADVGEEPQIQNLQGMIALRSQDWTQR
ncbi:DUF4153 domain-containing protein [Chelativorans sp.]|uniref:DUF4153 domain-containing protein n=1 Tax=Chelativorans sp. TaxID=2203393 RepID=UPI00281257DF|nr:DUF4153 domain-containing protein [Chelativorans sp.]